MQRAPFPDDVEQGRHCGDPLVVVEQIHGYMVANTFLKQSDES